MRRLSTHRHAPIPHPTHQGWPTCTTCGRHLNPKNPTPFCTRACARADALTRDAATQRAALLARDKGICANCGKDCAAIEVWLLTHHARLVDSDGRATADHIIARWKIQHHINPKVSQLWACDHVVPVWRGGGGCGLENLQTLCLGCHLDKSALEAGERAQVKRGSGRRR